LENKWIICNVFSHQNENCKLENHALKLSKNQKVVKSFGKMQPGKWPRYAF
jgi:hypothetical protein